MQYMYLHMGECQMCQCKVIQVKFTTEIMQSYWNKIEGHSFWLPSELVPVSLQQLQASSREIPRFGYRRTNSHPRPRVLGQFRESTIGFCSANVPALPGLGRSHSNKIYK